MPFDAERLLRDHGIPMAPTGHSHARAGWVNVHCPFCAGNPNFHLGISEDGRAAHCWRCGTHPVTTAVSRLLGVSEAQARAIMDKYRTRRPQRQQEYNTRVSILPLRLPRPNAPLMESGRRYLERRGFDPDQLEHDWGLKQTGPVSFLDGINYGHRILIPIWWNGEMASFQARDITDRAAQKYMACPRRREKVHHKNIIYGQQDQWSRYSALIVVEGATDVWRLGPCAVAVFGIEFKMEQVLLLSSIHDRFFIMFDGGEAPALRQARLLATRLNALGKKAEVLEIEGDPADMSQDDANHMVRELCGRR